MILRFIGNDGSMGLRHGLTYNVRITSNCSYIIASFYNGKDFLSCPYSSPQSFAANWEGLNIKQRRWILILNLYKYTDKEIEQIVKSITILVDTREKENSHITEWLTKKKIPFKTKALSNGDYSFFIPANESLNIERDLYFDHEIMIERKASLDELSGNFTQNRTRFEEEMATFSGKKYLMIENANYEDVINGNYKTKFSNKAFLASLHAFNHRYDLQITFMPNRDVSGYYIYGVFTYFLRNLLR